MGKKTETLRFAFGTAERPGSAVWRINTHKSHGDVYINNVSQLGNEVHIALHASGRFSAKLGNDRKQLTPPILDSSGVYWGLLMFFRDWNYEIPPPPASGKVDKINWLGWPAAGNIFIVRFVYTAMPEISSISVGDHIIAKALPVRLFHKEMFLHVLMQERTASAEETNAGSNSPFSPVDLRGRKPRAMELIRISNQPQGPSALIYDRFEVT